MEHQIINNAIAAVRVSSTKQGLQGDSPEDQIQQIKRFAFSRNLNIVQVFEFIESASGEFQPNQRAVDYCKNPKNNIKFFIVKSIDRFTRGGAYQYINLTRQLSKYGVSLVDTYGIIGGRTVNTLEHLGVKFSWSSYNPTQKSELLEAERSKDEVRDILTRMIGAEIRYVRNGYRVRGAPMGYINKKIDTDHGRRIILEPHPTESKWIIKMFKLKAQGILSDPEIAEETNKMGFKTRINKLHDPLNKTKVIGFSGGNPLRVPQLQRYLIKPVYAGINSEKWTEGRPVKARFKGLISIDLFNQANKGKLFIHEEGDTVSIHKAALPEWKLRKSKNNPLYPYKEHVLCPICKRPLLGSASKGKSGKYFPAYHCNRGHYFRVSLKDFDKTIEDFVLNIEFTPEYLKRFKVLFLERWNQKQKDVVDETKNIDEQISKIDTEIVSNKNKIKSLSSPEVISMIEEDILKLIEQKKRLEEDKKKKTNKKVDIDRILNKAIYYMEHLYELILSGEDKAKNAKFFAMLFDEVPTYEELTNGTPKLSPLIQLNEAFKKGEKQFVTLRRIELRLPG